MSHRHLRLYLVTMFQFAGAELCSRDLQVALNFICEGVHAADHAPGDPFYVFEHRHGLAEIVERGAGVHLGRFEEALRMRKAIYSGRLKILGEDHSETISAAYNYANSLGRQEHFEECKSLLLKVMPVMRRVLGESHETTLRMTWSYAAMLFNNPSATLDDIREAVSTLVDLERAARRVLGGEHPLTAGIGVALRNSRIALRARETPPGPGV